MRFGVRMLGGCATLFAAAVVSSAWAGTTPMTTELVASGLLRPVGLTAPSGDFNRVFVLEKIGRIRVIENGVLLTTPFLDINALVGGGTSTGDERGLLGLAFHPDYLNNGLFYVNYTNNAGATTVARYTVQGDPATSNIANSGSASILLTIGQPFSNHNGGWIAFGPNDGYLYIGTGDGGSGGDPGDRAQNLNQLLGKMLRIDVDGGSPYAIPPDNPFAGGGGLPEIWAYGLRNPWRNSFDPETGDLIIADVGQNAWEEINYQRGNSVGGENYGWRCMEGAHCFTSSSGCVCNQVGLVLPIHEYSHASGCSLTGGEIYRGCAMPDMHAEYFFADYCTSTIWSFDATGGNVTGLTVRTTELDPGPGSISSITSFGRDGYGEIYIVEQGSSSNNGEVYKIIPDLGGPVNDCNLNGAEDLCEIADGSALDDNANGVPDSCECQGIVDAPLAEAYGAGTCAGDGDCDNLASCIGDRCYAPKNRYACVDLTGYGTSIKVRVTHTDSGRQWWLGAISGGIAGLSDVPVDHMPGGLGEVCVTGCGISPGESYEFQAIESSCDIADEGSYSSALVIPTASTWGDTVGGTSGGSFLPPNGVANLEDVQSVVLGFQMAANAPPLTWSDLGDQNPNQTTNFADVLNAVGAFQGLSYPFAAPAGCP